METIKKLKPGELCTISGVKYRCTKAVEETVPKYLQVCVSCRECVNANGHRACEDMYDGKDMYGGFSCAMRFGHNCYPKKLKNQ